MRTAARLLLAAVAAVLLASPGFAQNSDDLVERPAPQPLDEFESDQNKDGVPDGWYNLRDARLVDEGGVIGPRYLKFECTKPGRPARLSRAFGIDGRKHEAIIIGLWVRIEKIEAGERMGDEPGLIIDFLGDKLRQLTRGTLGPWTHKEFTDGQWTRVSKRIPVPPGTRDAIMSVGLLGATGVLDVDGLTLDLVSAGGLETTNLLRNPGFELGDPEPDGWVSENGAHRGFPGFNSPAALELTGRGSRCITVLALPVDGLRAVTLSARISAKGLRGSGGAVSYVFFLDEGGEPLPGRTGQAFAFPPWAGSFDWREDRNVVAVPPGAVRAVFQIEKHDSLGAIKFDDLSVTASPDPGERSWTPYHVVDETAGWLPVEPSTGLEEKSALDFSFLLEGPAGKSGAVSVNKEGRFHFARAGRARFFGVQLLAPTAFMEPARADALAERLARSGVNLVRLGDLDTPVGPDRSLFDDTRDDTQRFDANALARLDHLMAALKKRGIYFALELQGARRFRTEDGVTAPGALPPGGGAPAVFNPTITKLADETARALLSHVNSETRLAYKHDPALAWVTLSGEVSAFNQLDDPSRPFPTDYDKEYRELAAKAGSSGRLFWKTLDETRWKGLADLLRKDGLKTPVAGVSYWRREHDFSEGQATNGLDLIDDRLYWIAPPMIAPRWRSMLWSLDGGMISEAARKRKTDRPYVVGQWCDYTQGVWASPFEAAEQILSATIARTEDWDALVRRGVFLYPTLWGSSAAGTAGLEDIFQIPEVANAEPHVFALWPHAASIFLRGGLEAKDREKDASRTKATPRRPAARTKPRHNVPGWEPDRGRLVVETPYTQGVAGWASEEAVNLPELTFDVESTYATVMASAVGNEPIARSKRLLVTAIARVSPTGFRWVDETQREAADPGRPPLLKEPVLARVTWRRKGTVKAYALDNNGARIGPAKSKAGENEFMLIIDGSQPTIHWELVAE